MSTETNITTKPEKATGITLSPDVRPMSLLPSSFADIMTLSGALANSALIPAALRGKPGDVAIIIATGLEFGFSPFVSLRQIYVVEGRPALSAAAQMAVVLARPDVCEYFRLVESTAEKATYETKRKGWAEPTPLTYTIRDAQNAGLANKPNWKLNPLKMLNNRCKSTLLDAVYSDLLLGMPSVDDAAEEAGFERARDVTPARERPDAGSRVLDFIATHAVEPAKEEPVAAPVTVEPPHDPATGEVTQAALPPLPETLSFEARKVLSYLEKGRAADAAKFLDKAIEDRLLQDGEEEALTARVGAAR